MKMTLVLAIAFAALVEAQIPDFTPPTPLIGAVMHNNTAEAKRLLTAGADPNEGRLLGFPGIFLPVVFRNDEVFHLMVEKGADLQARDASGSTALMWAASNEAGDPTMVEQLLRLGLDPNAKNKMGETAMTWASRRGSTKIVAMLEKAGASNPDGIKGSVQRRRAAAEIQPAVHSSFGLRLLPQSVATADGRRHGARAGDRGRRKIGTVGDRQRDLRFQTTAGRH